MSTSDVQVGDTSAILDNSSTKACKTPVGYVLNSADCDDNNRTAYPGASEIKHDGIDEDCNGYNLTIDILKANYQKNGKLRVEATSKLNDKAGLYLSSYGAMRWKGSVQEWTISLKLSEYIPIVTVCGIEGCESANVKKQ